MNTNTYTKEDFEDKPFDIEAWKAFISQFKDNPNLKVVIDGNSAWVGVADGVDVPQFTRGKTPKPEAPKPERFDGKK